MQPWPKTTELVGLTLTFTPLQDFLLPPNYTTHLYTWFLNQVRFTNPTLSTQLHNSQAEKAFTLSDFAEQSHNADRPPATPRSQVCHLQTNKSYNWTITSLSQEVTQWLAQWVKKNPSTMELRIGSTRIDLKIIDIAVTLSPTTYLDVWAVAEQRAQNACQAQDTGNLSFTFTTPTSFRRKGNHLPLPMPENIFHSYLRRWKHFADDDINPETFLEWVENHIIIQRYNIQSQKLQVGKQGSVTGFIGTLKLGITQWDNIEYVQMIYALQQYAPYCGTGYKTIFGLGQTLLGWHSQPTPVALSQSIPQAAQPQPSSAPPKPAIQILALKTPPPAQLPSAPALPAPLPQVPSLTFTSTRVPFPKPNSAPIQSSLHTTARTQLHNPVMAPVQQLNLATARPQQPQLTPIHRLEELRRSLARQRRDY